MILNDLLSFCKLVVIFTIRCVWVSLSLPCFVYLSLSLSLSLSTSLSLSLSLPPSLPSSSSPSTEQEELYRMLESLLVCLRHYSEEVQKKKGEKEI